MEVKKIPKKIVTLIEPQLNLIVDKEKYNQKRVAAYCRVSTDSEEQLTSYTTQKKVYTEMIAANREWQFAGLYADEGISGTKAGNRPEFQKMIRDCLAGKIDYIITKSVSRFARNTVECLECVRMLKSQGIGILFEEQNIDTLKSDSELYLVIYAGFAQSESESMSKNITWAVRKNFESGKVVINYGMMLGYEKGPDGEPQIIESEAQIVRSIFEDYIGGMTCLNIANKLNELGITTKKGKTWTVSSIQRLLRNEKYTGDAILQKTVTIDCIAKKRKKNMGDAPMYAVSNNHPAIIHKELFTKAQTEIARRQAIAPSTEGKGLTAQGKYSRYALTEIMKCDECGTKYRRVTWSRKGQKKIVWRCINRLDNGKVYCKHSPTIDEKDLHQAIVRAINNYNESDAQTFMMLMKTTIGQAIGLSSNNDEIDLLKRRVDSLNKKMMDIVSNVISDGKSFEDREEEFKNISEEIESLKARIKALEERDERNEERERKVGVLEETIEKRKGELTEYDDSIVRQMIECIKVKSNGTIEVIFGGGHTEIVIVKENNV